MEPADPLNLDTAQYDGAVITGAACAFCQQPTTDFYYQVGGRVACKHCQLKIAAELARTPHFWRAAGLGVLAAAAGAGIWYAVIALTGYELGLIAIAVGLLVGGAVKVGSGRVGGLSVQLLAVFLTYTAIVSSYAPLMLAEFKKAALAEDQKGGVTVERAGDSSVTIAGGTAAGAVEARAFLAALAAALTSWTTDSVVGDDQERVLDAAFVTLQELLAVNATPRFDFGDSVVSYAGAPLSEVGAWPWTSRLAGAGYPALSFQASVTRLDLLRLLDDVRQNPAEVETAGAMQFTFALALLVALLYLSPILAGVQNAIGILIIGFALWEAWRINRRPKVEITGPFEVGPAAR
jgi:hypothetical protein